MKAFPGKVAPRLAALRIWWSSSSLCGGNGIALRGVVSILASAARRLCLSCLSRVGRLSRQLGETASEMQSIPSVYPYHWNDRLPLILVPLSGPSARTLSSPSAPGCPSILHLDGANSKGSALCRVRRVWFSVSASEGCSTSCSTVLARIRFSRLTSSPRLAECGWLAQSNGSACSWGFDTGGGASR